MLEMCGLETKHVAMLELQAREPRALGALSPVLTAKGGGAWKNTKDINLQEMPVRGYDTGINRDKLADAVQ